MLTNTDIFKHFGMSYMGPTDRCYLDLNLNINDSEKRIIAITINVASILKKQQNQKLNLISGSFNDVIICA